MRRRPRCAAAELAQDMAQLLALPLCVLMALAMPAEARREAWAALAQLPWAALARRTTSLAPKPKGGAATVALLRHDAHLHLSCCCCLLVLRHGVHLHLGCCCCLLVLRHDAPMHGQGEPLLESRSSKSECWQGRRPRTANLSWRCGP